MAQRRLEDPCPRREDGKHVLGIGLWSAGSQSGISVKCPCGAEHDVTTRDAVAAMLSSAGVQPHAWMGRDEESEEFAAKFRGEL